ncbi:hypothetical protein ES703_42716 [subsurface metagenome]
MSPTDRRLIMGTPLPRMVPAVTVLVSGASAGFFAWSFTVTRQVFHSYIFFNNLTVQGRNRLILFLTAGALLFFIILNLLTTVLSRSHGRPGISPDQTAKYFTAGILLGFWPFLTVQAIEVYYPFQVFLLIAGFVAVAFLVAYNLSRQTRASRELHIKTHEAAERLSFSLLILFTTAYAVFFIVYTVFRHRSFHSYAFDLGWQHQVFYTLLHTGYPRVTLWVTLNHLSNHFQPLYYLLAPIYAIHQDASTLLILQSVLLSSAAIPIYLLARKRIGDPWTALIVAVVYLLYPPLHGMNNFDFHGLALLIPFMCFLLYGLELRNYRLFWIFFALALITREDTAISLSGVGLYLLLDRHQRKLGITVLAVCLGYFLLVITIMSALGGYADLGNYWALTVPEHQNFTGVIITMFTNPQFVFKHIFFDPAKLQYLLHILLPVVFLPLFASKAILLLLPGLAIMLLSNTFFNYSICCPYSAHIIPQVFFLTACGIQTIRKNWSRIKIPVVFLTLLAAGLLMNFEFGLILSKRFPGFLKPTARQQTVYSFFEQIPKDASITTTRRLVPHLAGRRQIHLMQAPHPDTDYILVDLYLPEPAIDTHEHWYQAVDPDHARAGSYILAHLESGDYGVVRFEDGFILLKKEYDNSANESTARKIRSIEHAEKPTIIDYYSDPAKNVNESRYSQSDLFNALLITHSRNTIVLAAKGDVAVNLSYLCKKYMVMRGSNIHTLRRGGSYLAVMHKERIVLEIIDNDQPVEIHSSSYLILQSLLPDLELAIYSSGRKHDSRASIRISGQEYSLNRPGMNVLVLDSLGQVREQAVYDTGR